MTDLDWLYGALDRAIEREEVTESEARAEWFAAEEEAAREAAEFELREWGY